MSHYSQEERLPGRGGGLVVSVLAFYYRRSEFDSRRSLQFFCKIVAVKNKNKQKEAGVGPFKKKVVGGNISYNLSTTSNTFLAYFLFLVF